MNRIIFFILSLSLCSHLYGQGFDSSNKSNLTHYHATNGVQAFPNQLIIPQDTGKSLYWSPLGSIAVKGGRFYVNNGTTWAAPSGSTIVYGGYGMIVHGGDTVIADTAIMFAALRATIVSSGVTLVQLSDSLASYVPRWLWNDSLVAHWNAIQSRVKYSDTASMLSGYTRLIQFLDSTADHWAAIQSKLNISDTTGKWLSAGTLYFKPSDSNTHKNPVTLDYYNAHLPAGTDTTALSNRINLKLSSSDTPAMLSPYLRSDVAAATYQPLGNYLTFLDTNVLSTKAYRQKGVDSLNATIALRLKYTDTGSMLAPYLRTASATTYSAGRGLGLSGTVFFGDSTVLVYANDSNVNKGYASWFSVWHKVDSNTHGQPVTLDYFNNNVPSISGKYNTADTTWLFRKADSNSLGQAITLSYFTNNVPSISGKYNTTDTTYLFRKADSNTHAHAVTYDYYLNNLPVITGKYNTVDTTYLFRKADSNTNGHAVTPTYVNSRGFLTTAVASITAGRGISVGGTSTVPIVTADTSLLIKNVVIKGTGTIYTTPSVGTNYSGIDTVTLALASQSAYTILGNNTSGSAAPTFFTPTLASALFQNQGTTTTLLHGNASGNPSWTQVLGADIASSVALAGSPTTTTQTSGDNSTKVATTAYVDKYFPADTSVAAAYTLTSRDAGRTLHCTNGSNIALTVPTGLGTAFWCVVIQEGAGTVTPTTSSTTFNFIPTATTKTKQAGSAITIRSWATANTFTIQGDLQ